MDAYVLQLTENTLNKYNYSYFTVIFRTEGRSMKNISIYYITSRIDINNKITNGTLKCVAYYY